jgi:hypothetical protein
VHDVVLDLNRELRSNYAAPSVIHFYAWMLAGVRRSLQYLTLSCALPFALPLPLPPPPQKNTLPPQETRVHEVVLDLNRELRSNYAAPSVIHFYAWMLAGVPSGVNSPALTHAVVSFLWRVVLPEHLGMESLLYQVRVCGRGDVACQKCLLFICGRGVVRAGLTDRLGRSAASNTRVAAGLCCLFVFRQPHTHPRSALPMLPSPIMLVCSCRSCGCSISCSQTQTCASNSHPQLYVADCPLTPPPRQDTHRHTHHRRSCQCFSCSISCCPIQTCASSRTTRRSCCWQPRRKAA